MPPKIQKLTKEEEAAKLLEEQKKKEEEERVLREEQRKFAIVILPTGLYLTLTEYYIQEAMIAQDCIEFTTEYVKKVLQNSGCFEKFRQIDITLLVEQIVYDLCFAKIEMGWNDQQTQVLLNIMYEVYKYLNPKLNNEQSKVDAQQNKRRTSKQLITKSLENDWTLFKQLITQHSTDGVNNQKYFNSQELQQILDYVRKTYFAHSQLLQLAQKIEQRPHDIVLNLQIEKPPTTLPSLSVAFNYVPLDVPQEQKQPTEHEEEQQIEEPPREPTDEELLEPQVLAMIQQRLAQVQEQFESKLELRQNDLGEKLVEIQNQGKKGKK